MHVLQKLHGRWQKCHIRDSLLTIQKLKMKLVMYASPFWINNVKIINSCDSPFHLASFWNLENITDGSVQNMYLILDFKRGIYHRKIRNISTVDFIKFIPACYPEQVRPPQIWSNKILQTHPKIGQGNPNVIT